MSNETRSLVVACRKHALDLICIPRSIEKLHASSQCLWLGPCTNSGHSDIVAGRCMYSYKVYCVQPTPNPYHNMYTSCMWARYMFVTCHFVRQRNSPKGVSREVHLDSPSASATRPDETRNPLLQESQRRRNNGALIVSIGFQGMVYYTCYLK